MRTIGWSSANNMRKVFIQNPRGDWKIVHPAELLKHDIQSSSSLLTIAHFNKFSAFQAAPRKTIMTENSIQIMRPNTAARPP